jgi:hypothetical protein
MLVITISRYGKKSFKFCVTPHLVFIIHFYQYYHLQSSIKWIPELNVLISASWDKSIKVWDLRQAQPAGGTMLPEKIHCMDAASPAVVVATADKKMKVFDITTGEYLKMHWSMIFLNF